MARLHDCEARPWEWAGLSSNGRPASIEPGRPRTSRARLAGLCAFIALLATLTFSTIAGATVTFNNASSGNNPSCVAGALTWSHTTTGASILLLVAIGGTFTAATVTYNSLPMTQILTTTSTDTEQLHVYRLAVASGGTHNVVATPSTGGHIVYGVGLSFNGASTTAAASIVWATPGVPVATRATSTTLAAGDMTAGFVGTLSNTTITATSGQAVRATGSRTCGGSTLEIKGATNAVKWMNWSYSPSAEDAAAVLAVKVVPYSAPPVLETVSITEIKTTSAVVTGKLTSYGTAFQVVVGAVGGTQQCVSNCGPFTNGTDVLPQTFVVRIVSLSNCTTQAAWVVGTQTLPFLHGEGAHLNFTTACPASVTTLSAADIQPTSATFRGSLTVFETGGSSPPACIVVFFQWGDTVGLGNETAHQSACGVGVFSWPMYGLFQSNRTYYYRAGVTGTDYTKYGGVVSFHTLSSDSSGSDVSISQAINAVWIFAFGSLMVLTLMGALWIKRKRDGG